MTHSNLCLIPARPGSKRLPGKNTFFLDRVIQTAKASGCFDSIVVSTNCPRCKKIAFEEGVETHVRATKCARDDSTLEDFLVTFIKEEMAAARHWDTITMILATAALLTKEDIQGVIAYHKKEDLAVTMAVTKVFHPVSTLFFVNSNPEKGRIFTLTHKELTLDATKLYVDNGSIYALNPEKFLKDPSFYPDGVGLHFVPKHLSIDLDDEEDLIILEALLK